MRPALVRCRKSISAALEATLGVSILWGSGAWVMGEMSLQRNKVWVCACGCGEVVNGGVGGWLEGGGGVGPRAAGPGRFERSASWRRQAALLAACSQATQPPPPSPVLSPCPSLPPLVPHLTLSQSAIALRS